MCCTSPAGISLAKGTHRCKHSLHRESFSLLKQFVVHGANHGILCQLTLYYGTSLLSSQLHKLCRKTAFPDTSNKLPYPIYWFSKYQSLKQNVINHLCPRAAPVDWEQHYSLNMPGSLRGTVGLTHSHGALLPIQIRSVDHIRY